MAKSRGREEAGNHTDPWGSIWEEKGRKRILTGLCFLGGQTVISPQFSKVPAKKAKDQSVLTLTFQTGSPRPLTPSAPLTRLSKLFPSAGL